MRLVLFMLFMTIRQMDVKILQIYLFFSKVYYFNMKYYITIIPRLYHDYTTIIPRLYHDYTTIISRLYHDYITIIPRLYHDYITIIPRLYHDYITIMTTIMTTIILLIPSFLSTKQTTEWRFLTLHTNEYPLPYEM